MTASMLHHLPSLDSLRPSLLNRPRSYDEPIQRTLPSPLELSRPSSTASTQASSSSYFPPPPPPVAQHFQRQRHLSVQLPGLSSLSSLSSLGRAVDAPRFANPFSNNSHYPPQFGMATVAPGQANSQAADEPPVCQNCSTFKTPLWRRDDSGSVLCNACGLFLKLHGRPRPISLKTDVIKSRNRVKIPQQAGQKRKSGPSLAAAHPDAASSAPRRQESSAFLDNPQPEPAFSRSTTPTAYTPAQPLHPPNIAPQHIFDSANVSGADGPSNMFTMASQYSPDLGLNDQRSGQQPSIEALMNENNALRTRVSELELVNDLFRGRVTQLERELAARQAVEASDANEANDARQAVEAVLRASGDGEHLLDRKPSVEAAVEGEEVATLEVSGSKRMSKRPRLNGEDAGVDADADAQGSNVAAAEAGAAESTIDPAGESPPE